MATSNPYSDSLLMNALRGSLSNAESFGRGFGVAPVGLLGDINALAREYITPRLPANVQGLLQSMPSAPTTESILSAIPRMTPRRMETAGMEQIGSAANPRGPINLGRAVASLPSDVARAGQEFLAAGQPARVVAQVKPSFQYPQEQALKLAQERAALPVEQGGLGLLAENTPEMRAQAMGFEGDWFHGTQRAPEGITKFGSNEGYAGQKNSQANWFTSEPASASNYANWIQNIGNATVYPVKIKSGKEISLKELNNLTDKLNLGQLPEISLYNKTLQKKLNKQGVTDITWNPYMNESEQYKVVFDPSNIRSRFAAFDPFRKDVATATAMGVALPDLLAAEYNQQPQSAGLLYPLP